MVLPPVVVGIETDVVIISACRRVVLGIGGFSQVIGGAVHLDMVTDGERGGFSQREYEPNAVFCHQRKPSSRFFPRKGVQFCST